MTHGSLFSGIGGFDLAAEWMGWENVFHCEKDNFCQRILKHYWPDAKNYGDITKTDFAIHRGEINVLTGGWPCQKYSIAGKRIGDEPLKEEFIRAIREIEAPWVVLENVHNFIGKQFAKEHDELCMQLENISYETQTFDIDAASCGLSTLERHIWIIATSDRFRQKRKFQETIPNIKTQQGEFQGNDTGKLLRWDVPEARVCQLGQGFSYRMDGITISKWHGESVQALGNAIPPPVACEIFKTIEQFEKKIA